MSETQITLTKMVEILTSCAAISLDSEDGALCYPSINELNGKDENEFLYISWMASDGYECSSNFVERDNKNVNVICGGISFELTDFEGSSFHITPLYVGVKNG